MHNNIVVFRPRLVRVEELVLRRMISSRLKEEFHMLSNREENFIVDIALKDFLNYIKVMKNIEGDILDVYNYVGRLLEERPLELKKEFDEWIDEWILKWRTRVKIAVNEDEFKKIAINFDKEIDEIISKLPFLDELKEYVLGSIIRAGEVCMTNLITDSIIKAEIAKFFSNIKDVNKTIEILSKNTISLINSINKKVKFIRNYKGPLVVLRFDLVVFHGTTDRLSR